MKKRILSILMILCVVLTILPVTASAVRLDWPHPSAHCVCGGNHQNINGHTTEEVVYFTKDGKENASGDISNMNAIKSQEDFSTINFNFTNNKGKTFYGYLANDVTITKQLNIADGCTLVLCLHGRTLTCNILNQACAFNLWKNARLVITDCQMSGDRGLITGDCRAAAYVPESSTLDLYGVSICMTSSDSDGLYDRDRTPICGVHNGGTFNMYGGCYYQKSDQYPTDRPVISNIRNTKNGAGVVNEGTFNMYDGIISGNARHGVLSTSIYVEDTINLYGGTITGNTGAGLSTSRWPAPDDYENTKYTTINLYGGTISENTGAGIDAIYGKVTMAQQSSAIPVEIKNNKGGAITLTKSGSTAKLGTGTITGNSGGKGAVALTAGSLTLTGDVNITGNSGANLYLATGKTVTLDNLGSGAQIGLTTEDTAVPLVFAEANGTNYASRFTPDNAGYSIGYNAAQQLQLQTKTYTVTYAPGADGTGESQTVGKDHDGALELQDALFTRCGYTQVGWSKVDGGEKDYNLGSIYEQNADLTLYPVWQERDDYTVHIVNRDGTTLADFENVKWTDEIWKLLTPTPTRENNEKLQRLLLGTRRVVSGDTYGKLATGGEDSLTLVAVWSGSFANRSTISIGDSLWTGYRVDGSERFFRDDQMVTLTVPHPEELLYFRYAVSDRFFETAQAAASNLRNDFVDYKGNFSTASLNLEEGKPYVIYGYLLTESVTEIVINTEKIIIDKTAPAITGAKNGDVFCGEGDKTFTVTDLYLDTVTVNGTAVTPNEQGEITLTDAREPQTVIATDKAGNSTTLTVTVHSSHSYKWQTGNGQYWGECEFCGSKVEKKDIPTVTITCPDVVCRTQDFEFSFLLPEGCTNPAYSYEFLRAGDGEPVSPVDGLCTGMIPANSYIEGEDGFRFTAYVTTAEGYRVSVSKDITIREHSGGTATCTAQAVCEHCGQSYGEPAAHNFTAEKAEEQYLKSAATCTEKAVYYKSCAVCGASSKGTADEASFASGTALNHNWGSWISTGNGTHQRVCSRDASHIDTEACSYTGWTIGRYQHWHTCTVCNGETDAANHSDQNDDHLCDTCGKQITEHDFTAENTDSKYRKSEANCQSPAVYYKSCAICGEQGTETFTHGEINPDRHTGTLGSWQNDSANHWRCYSCCQAEVQKAPHHGGTATCTEKAVCLVCGTEYGNVLGHDFSADWTPGDNEHWKQCSRCDAQDGKDPHEWDNGEITKQATCMTAGERTYACSVCDKKKTEQIDATGHSWKQEWTHDATHHWHECANENCDLKNDTAKKEGYAQHSGGTATCIAKAVCEDCKVEYGEEDPANHVGTEGWTKRTATTHEKKWSCCGAESVTERPHNWADGVCLDCEYVCLHTGGTATCTAKAVCAACKGEYGEIDPNTHAEDCKPEWIRTATEHEQKYSRCGKEIVAKALHRFGSWTTTLEPSSSKTGERERLCEDCQYKEVQTIPTTGGSGGGYSSYTIKATAGVGGSISPSGNVSVRSGKSQTFTITPDAGYRVSDVKIDSKSIGAVTTYTFENVKKSHTIEVSFAKSSPFVDVPDDSYYADAVDWAIKNGVTTGTDGTHFTPDGLCTRAQAVTFLWRAAGSPAPQSGAMPFADVPADSYYYKAVLWAVENGVTKGPSETRFSPEESCTRGQIVTFLWRSEKSPAANGDNPFADVAADAYYTKAVL